MLFNVVLFLLNLKMQKRNFVFQLLVELSERKLLLLSNPQLCERCCFDVIGFLSERGSSATTIIGVFRTNGETAWFL
jgi:hypothetical protein